MTAKTMADVRKIVDDVRDDAQLTELARAIKSAISEGSWQGLGDWDVARFAAYTLSAAGYGLVTDSKRGALDLQQIADVIMTRVVYAGNEGWVLTSEDRDDHEYTHCLNAAQAIIDRARAAEMRQGGCL